MSDYPYNFDAKIVKYDFGKMYYSVVYVPKEILSQLDFSESKRLRIDGEIEGIRIEAALMPTKGKWVSDGLEEAAEVVRGHSGRPRIGFIRHCRQRRNHGSDGIAIRIGSQRRGTRSVGQLDRRQASWILPPSRLGKNG